MDPKSAPLVLARWVTLVSRSEIDQVFDFINLGIGAFYGKTDDEEAYKALTYAADRGMTFWDCADIYGTST